MPGRLRGHPRVPPRLVLIETTPWGMVRWRHEGPRTSHPAVWARLVIGEAVPRGADRRLSSGHVLNPHDLLVPTGDRAQSRAGARWPVTSRRFALRRPGCRSRAAGDRGRSFLLMVP